MSHLGWKVQGVAGTEQAALDLLHHISPDLAILDIKLEATDSIAVAKQCWERGTPVLFLTGYITNDLPKTFSDAPVLAKPFSTGELERGIERALEQASTLRR